MPASSLPDLAGAAPHPVIGLRLSPLFLGLLALLLSLATAWAAPVPPTGGLVLRAPDAAPDAGSVTAPLLKTDIAVEVDGPTARAVVTQAFRNPSARWMEGTYLFPLPEDAAVDGMTLVVGGRVIVADIRERKAAERLYAAARAEGRAAALTAQERPNVFTNAVANIAPGETVLVRITYQQALGPDAGVYPLRLPLVVAPRYGAVEPAQPDGATATVAAATRGTAAFEGAGPVLDPSRHAPINPVTVSVRLRAGFPLAEVASATHAIRVAGDGPREREVTLADGPVPADRDFVLTWRAAPQAAPSVGLFRERLGGETFLLALVTPPDSGRTPRRPRDVTFVIDNSGSMAGASIRQARAALLAALARLRPGDSFNVIRFDDMMEALFPASVPAEADAVRRAERFVAGIEARGGTEMLAPLRAALADPNPGDTDHVRQVVFLTDGAISGEAAIFSAIAHDLGRSRLFMVGIGSAPNGDLMRRAAEIGRGSFTQIATIDQVTERMRQLFAKLESPAVTDIAATFSAGEADVTPSPLPDLYRGEPLVLSARLPGDASGTLALAGSVGGTPWRETLDLAQAAEGQGISKVWARHRIGDAETARVTGALAPEAADARILALALAHGLTTRLTSLVAVDATPRRPAGAPLTAADLPLNLPAGWDFASVFGHDGDIGPGDAGPAPPPRERRAELSQPGAAQLGLSLPQTATGYRPRLLVGLILLALGWLAARAALARRPA